MPGAWGFTSDNPLGSGAPMTVPRMVDRGPVGGNPGPILIAGGPRTVDPSGPILDGNPTVPMAPRTLGSLQPPRMGTPRQVGRVQRQPGNPLMRGPVRRRRTLGGVMGGPMVDRAPGLTV